MERCYVCNSCGKCAESALAVTAAGPRCLDCGREGPPRAKQNRCAAGGSRHNADARPGASGAPAR